jgi:hypothetical protein
LRRGSDYQGISNFLGFNTRYIGSNDSKGIILKIYKFSYFGGDVEGRKVGENGQNIMPVISAKIIMASDTSYVIMNFMWEALTWYFLYRRICSLLKDSYQIICKCGTVQIFWNNRNTLKLVSGGYYGETEFR